MKKTYYIGGDPEIFVTNRGGQLLSARRALGLDQELFYYGTGVTPGTELFKFYPDGLALEASIQPQMCTAQWVSFWHRFLWKAYQRTNEFGVDLTLKNTFDIGSQIEEGAFPLDDLQLGCKPSQNAYHEPPPELYWGIPVRSAGGHIHLDLVGLKGMDLDLLVRALDQYIGVLGVTLAAGVDDPKRRRYYGRAGEYRQTSYGLEYRVLSNFWMGHPTLANLIGDLIRRIPHAVMEAGLAGTLMEPARVQATINDCDTGEAQRIVRENWPFYKAVADSFYYGPDYHRSNGIAQYINYTPEKWTRALAVFQKLLLNPVEIIGQPSLPLWHQGFTHRNEVSQVLYAQS